jgi:glycosyltransferase involved in cell wall biosynthesis
MGQKQALQHVLDAAGSLSDDSHVQITLVGQGPQMADLNSEIARKNLLRIRLLSLLPAGEVAAMLTAADALLVSQRAEVVDSVLPSKALSYMASGRPIIAAVDQRSATAGLIRAANCGLVVAPEDSGALLGGIETLQRNPRISREMGANGRRYVAKRFAKVTVMREWDALLAGMVPGVHI